MRGPEGRPVALSRSRGLRFEAGAVSVLLLALALQAGLGMRLLNAAYDETVHLAAGYTYLKTGQLRLNPEHPPLIKQLCALPLLALEPVMYLGDPAWASEPPQQFGFGYRFLYANDADQLLFWGRLPVVVLSLVLGVYVFVWARALFGLAAGTMALFLYALCPNVVAHSRVVTMDIGLACFFVMTLYHEWRFVRGGGFAHLLGTGAGLGLALAAKFSAVLLVPAVVILLVVAASGPSCGRPPAAGSGETARSRLFDPWPLPGGAGIRLASLALAASVVLGTATVLVWVVYYLPSDPLFYWKGLRTVNQNHDPLFREYLMGEFRAGGWWYYFLAAFLFKTPVPTLIALVASVALLRRRRAGRWLDEAFLVVPGAIFFGATSALASDIGLRYVLPVYPLVFIFVSRLARMLRDHRAARVLALALGAWYVIGAVRIHPDNLAYFNELVGGPENGHKYLDDSNIDWGQDLKRLKGWMDGHRVEQIKLLYSGAGPPGYYGIRAEPVTAREWEVHPDPGWYAMSTQMLIRGELIARERRKQTNWLSRYRPVDRIGYSLYIFKFD